MVYTTCSTFLFSQILTCFRLGVSGEALEIAAHAGLGVLAVVGTDAGACSVKRGINESDLFRERSTNPPRRWLYKTLHFTCSEAPHDRRGEGSLRHDC